jgi:hypothetical protein
MRTGVGAKLRGQAKAMAEGRYKGRREDVERNQGNAKMLAGKRYCSLLYRGRTMGIPARLHETFVSGSFQ